MKKLLVLCSFVCAAGILSAQADVEVKKACTKKSEAKCIKTAAASADADTKVASAMTSADMAAEKDESIVRKECAYSGNVSFYRKEVCEKSGKVAMAEVSYDEEKEAFVNVSPKEVMAEKEAKVVKASEKSEKSAKKACCAGKKAKSCSKKEGA